MVVSPNIQFKLVVWSSRDTTSYQASFQAPKLIFQAVPWHVQEARPHVASQPNHLQKWLARWRSHRPRWTFTNLDTTKIIKQNPAGLSLYLASRLQIEYDFANTILSFIPYFWNILFVISSLLYASQCQKPTPPSGKMPANEWTRSWLILGKQVLTASFHSDPFLMVVSGFIPQFLPT